jgi:hypothetical protein
MVMPVYLFGYTATSLPMIAGAMALETCAGKSTHAWCPAGLPAGWRKLNVTGFAQ